MLKGKEFCAVVIVVPSVGTYINRATDVQYEANTSNFHSMYSNIVLKVVSQNYGRECSVVESEKLGRDVCTTNRKVVTIFCQSADPNYLRQSSTAWTIR